MIFETENLQWFMEQYNEDFGNKGNLNLIVAIDEMAWHTGTAGYDLVTYDVSELDVRLANYTELVMYCTEHGLDEETFEIERVTLVKTIN